MKYIILLIAVFICNVVRAQTTPSYFIEGQIKNQNGKGLKGAEINIFRLNKIFTTDKNGNYFISLPAEVYLARISANDYKAKEIYINLKRDTVLNIVLESVFGGIILGEVTFKGRSTDKVTSAVSGIEVLDSKTTNKMPALLGERDPVRALQLLPGVTGTTEGSAEMNVRGGGNDQNMVSIDNIPLYSSTHLFGLYSSFNPLAISSTTLYKGDFPASYGGRLSSVINLVSTDTITKDFNATAELGITSGKAAIAIPLLKQKAAIYIAGRRSFYDVLFKTFGRGNADVFNFQDYNLGWIYRPDKKNQLKLTMYYEGDAIGTTRTETGISKGAADKNQKAFGLNWKHSFNSNLANDLSLYYNDFSNMLSEEKRKDDQSYLYNFKSSIADVGISNTLNYSLSGKSKFYAGVNLIQHKFRPTSFTGDEQGVAFNVKNISDVNATDISFFAESQFDLNGGGKLRLGARNNNYFNRNQFSYQSVEPRISYLQPLGDQSSIKLSYSLMNQPVQRLNNPGLGLPQDIILSAGPDIKPQKADHLSMEYARDFSFDQEQFSFSLQPFYKRLKNIISFRDGYDTRSLMYGSNYQAGGYNEIITTGRGHAYGLEMMLEKKTGKLNGWVSYTLLKASSKFNDLNKGNYFSPPQDRRHNMNMVANWQLTKKWNIGLSWMFISGQPINVPENLFKPVNPDYITGGLSLDNHERNFLFEQGERGNYRMKPFHKLDITAEYKFKLAGMYAVWNIGAYNIYNRLNPSFYYLGKSDGSATQTPQPVLKSVSLFPVIPSASLRVSF